ncbi:LysR family transcriptional regulator [Pararhodobacter oceanensis]|uniref:Transcriptional regulator n=1 Tax=Pararhodobacter oceanensis TaxID=2172121 RepID=A0A2T8HPH8_9RHOB|nr:LysR family transcriptional regulator [Pararhodobacter oceanensis]PVH27313.1 transcriptional regulator [Pararhodobacter oceanensis]
MKKYRRSLPPLDYILFYEAVARTGSFTRAAEELSVSQAAVSKRIKNLETMLGCALVLRDGRRISLTPSGSKLATIASESLDFLNAGLMQIRDAAASTKLTLAANLAVSQFWLTPRVNAYLLTPDPAPLTLTVSDNDADLLTTETDACIYYGDEIPPGWDATLLFKERWMPLVAPSLKYHDLHELALLDFDKLTLKWINWSNFATLKGETFLDGAERVNLRSYGATLDAALRGEGAALGSPEVLHKQIETGQLLPLDAYALDTGRSYFLLTRNSTLTPRIRALFTQIFGYPI